MSDAAINALIQELTEQRALLGNRAARLAAANAELAVQLESANKRIAALEKPKDVPA